MSTRAQNHMRHQWNTPDIVQTFASPPKHQSRSVRLRRLWGCVQGDPRWFDDLHQARARVYPGGSTEGYKGAFRRFRFHPLSSLTKFTDILPRSRGVETLDTPEHLTPLGYHNHSLPARFKLDVRRRPSGLHQGEHQC